MKTKYEKMDTAQLEVLADAYKTISDKLDQIASFEAIGLSMEFFAEYMTITEVIVNRFHQMAEENQKNVSCFA